MSHLLHLGPELIVTGTMMTKIFHPNVSKGGEICVDTLKKGWKREYGVGHVLVVSCLSRNPDQKPRVIAYAL